MNIPETLYRLRTARGISQEALADALGVSRQAVSKWETGAAVPDVDKIVQLSEFYGVTTDEILKGEAAAPENAPAPQENSENALPHMPEPETDSPHGGGKGAAQDGQASFRIGGAAAAAAPALFVRVWPVFCTAVCAVSTFVFFLLWVYAQFFYLGFYGPAEFALLGTVVSLSGVLLFEFGGLFVPALRQRRASFYTKAVWGLVLLPCCLASGIVSFVFDNWLEWRLNNVIGWAGTAFLRVCAQYLLPIVLYGGACTSVADSAAAD